MTSGASVPQPPAVARALLKLMLPRGILRESVVGDLDQEFSRRAGHTGIPALRRWYRREALSLAAYGLRCRMAPRRPGRRDRGGRNRIGRAQWRRPLELLTDLQHAARALRKHPGPVVLTVLSLALGIGATTTMLSVVDAIDFRPLPYGDAARIVEMSRTSPVTGEAGYPASPGLFRDWQERTRSYEALAAATIIAAAFGDEGAENLSGARVTEDFFPTLKVAPILGRTFTPEEVRQGARVLMISYDGWRTVFGGDRDVIGQTARVSWAGEFRTVPAEPFTVVGVLPPGAQYPRGSDVWLPAADSQIGRAHV